MIWDLLLFVAFGSWVVMGILLIRQNRSLVNTMLMVVEAMAAQGEGMSRVIAGLAVQINENGHVDLSEEEWKATEGADVTLVEQDGGIRVLAK